MEPAQKHFQAVLEIEAPEGLRGLSRNGLRKIVERGLKARGRGWAAVFYLLDARRLGCGTVLMAQLTQSISQLSLKPGEEEIKKKGWWQFWR